MHRWIVVPGLVILPFLVVLSGILIFFELTRATPCQTTSGVNLVNGSVPTPTAAQHQEDTKPAVGSCDTPRHWGTPHNTPSPTTFRSALPQPEYFSLLGEKLLEAVREGSRPGLKPYINQPIK